MVDFDLVFVADDDDLGVDVCRGWFIDGPEDEEEEAPPVRPDCCWCLCII